ncbi:MAG TPA: RNA polymerase sigma factor [Polyangiaceae bacterium]
MPDREVFASLYQRFAPVVFRRAQRLLGTEAEAQEVVQDVFLSLYEKPEQFAGKSSLTTFLYSVTTHACFTRLRNHRTRQRLLAEHVGYGSEPAAGELGQEKLLLLRRVVAELPDDVASALVYSCVDGMSHEEIARLLDCSRRHVGDLIARASELARLHATETRAC